MPVARPTFVIQIVPEEGVAVVENVRTGERVRVVDLSAIAVQIRRWLAGAEEPREEERCEP